MEENWSCFLFSVMLSTNLNCQWYTKQNMDWFCICCLLLVYFFFGLCLETTCYINIHDFEQPHFCFNRFLSVRKLQRVRETLWMLPAHHTPWETPWELLTSHTPCESERHLESCLHRTLKARETLRAAFIHIKHLESERHPESCLHHTHLVRVRETLRAAYTHQTPWEWEKPWELLTSHLVRVRGTLWELPASHLVRVRDTLRAACITPCESERHPESCLHHNLWESEKNLATVAQWDTLWEFYLEGFLVSFGVVTLCEKYLVRYIPWDSFYAELKICFVCFTVDKVGLTGQKTSRLHMKQHLFLETALLFSDLHNVWNLWASPCMRLIDTGVKIQNKHFETIYPWTCFLFVFSCQDLHFCCTQLGK